MDRIRNSASKPAAAAVVFSAAALIAALVFAGCAIGVRDGDGGGAMTLSFSAAPGSKAFGDEVAYAYVYNGNVLLPGGPYSGILVDGYGTVTIDNIPAGSNYSILVFLDQNLDGHLYSFGETYEPVTVTAGSETVVQMYIDWSVDYNMQVFGEVSPYLPVKSAAAPPNGEYIGAVVDGGFYDGYGLGTLIPSGYSMPQVNSVSMGYFYGSNAVLVNTEDGLYVNTDGYTREDPSGDSSVNVLKSASHEDFYVLKTPTALIGGSDAYGWTTVNLGPSRGISDMFVYNDGESTYSYVYLATNFAGAFVLPEEFFYLSFGEGEPLDYLLNPDLLAAYEMSIYPFSTNEYWGPAMPRILSFGRNREWDGLLYIGTTNGLYVSSSYDGYGPGYYPILVPGTEGLAINKVVVGQYGGAACMTSSGVILVTYDYEYSTVTRLPFLGLWSGTVNDIGLCTDGYGSTLLLAAGNNGLLSMNVNNWLPDGGDM